MLPQFEYRAARTLAEAAALWQEKPGARYLAGGTDLLPQMRSRRKVSRLVDVKQIPDLGSLSIDAGGNVRVGASLSLGQIAAHPLIQERFPLLVDCCRAVGAYPLRNRATMAGNICNASPAADTAVALLALEAEVATSGPRGQRTIPVTQFFRAPGETGAGGGRAGDGYRAARNRRGLAWFLSADFAPAGHGPGDGECAGRPEVGARVGPRARNESGRAACLSHRAGRRRADRASGRRGRDPAGPGGAGRGRASPAPPRWPVRPRVRSATCAARRIIDEKWSASWWLVD